MNLLSTIRRTGLVAVGLALSIAQVASAATVSPLDPPVLGGLFVQLNGDNLTTAGGLSRWSDQAGTGAGNHQDFLGGNAGSNLPTVVLNAAMPNTDTANILNFNRGNLGTVANNRSSSTTSQFMRSVAGGSDTATSVGTDAAYQTNQLTHFTVFRSSAPDSAAVRNRNQMILSADYSTSGNMWLTGTASEGYDSTGAPITPSNNTPDLYMGVRDNTPVDPGPPVAGGPQQKGRGIADLTQNRWYIAATSWNNDTGATRMVIYDELGNVMDSGFTISPANVDLSSHLMTFLGISRLTTGGNTPSTNDFAFGGDMAEVLMYNTALGTFDTNKVINYLNDKYFGADTVMPIPEPNSLILSALAFAGGLRLVRRRRKVS